MARQALDIGIVRSISSLTLRLAGDLDVACADAVVAAALDLMAGGAAGADVVVDLAGVGFCDSAGINALVRIRKLSDQDGRSLRVTNPQPAVRRVLDITGLGTHLKLA